MKISKLMLIGMLGLIFAIGTVAQLNEFSIESTNITKLVGYVDEPVYENITRESPIWSTCEQYHEENKTWGNYTCLNGTTTKYLQNITGYKKIPIYKNIGFNLTYGGLIKTDRVIDFEDGNCKIVTAEDFMEITCDVQGGDSNGDGICQSGEEDCKKFIITKQGLEEKYNTRLGYAEKSESTTEKEIKVYTKEDYLQKV